MDVKRRRSLRQKNMNPSRPSISSDDSPAEDDPPDRLGPEKSAPSSSVNQKSPSVSSGPSVSPGESDSDVDISAGESNDDGISPTAHSLVPPPSSRCRRGGGNRDENVSGSHASSSQNPYRDLISQLDEIKRTNESFEDNGCKIRPRSTAAAKSKSKTLLVTPQKQQQQQQPLVTDYNGVRVSRESLPSNKHIDDVENSGSSLKIVLWIFLTLLVSVCVWFGSQQNNRDGLVHGDQLSQAFAQFGSKLKTSFPNQTKRTLQSFHGPLRRVLGDGPESTEPAVLLIAGDPRTVRCLVAKAARDLRFVTNSSSPSNPLILEGTQIRSRDAWSAKTLIDSAIRHHLDSDAEGIVVIFDVDLIPAGATLLLHAFADHENAPYKQAFFFLTVSREYQTATAASSAQQRETERRIVADLDASLSRILGGDATKALMARIGNSVVYVARGEEEARACE